MTIIDCIMVCANDKEFVANYDRLKGTNLSRRGTGLDIAIDDATGRFDKEAKDFLHDVIDLVWERIER